MKRQNGINEPQCPDGAIYTIKPGDSLFTLAQRFNTTVEDIIAANPGIDPRNLQLGQTICIPAVVTGPCPGGFLYTIKAGDTFFNIARRFNISTEALTAANPQVDPDRLEIDQQICIPAPRPPSPCPNASYTIRPGDTIYSIARLYKLSVESILAANPGLDPRNLQIGQVICLPPEAGPGPIPCPGGSIYVVQPGDTLYQIGKRRGVALNILIAANPHITNPNNLRAGEYVCIPSKVPIGE